MMVCLNRTFMELKSSQSRVAKTASLSLNRTFMELKWAANSLSGTYVRS